MKPGAKTEIEKMIFSEMVKPQNIGDITRKNLRALSNAQLEAFARLLGIPYSGDHSKRVERIFAALETRHFLTASDDPNFYETKFSRKVLVNYTKKINCYVSSTKYGLAVGLLNWRLKCRRDGTRFYNEMRAEAAKHPKQIRLF
ncbi:MAG TPA: hypothetical protein VK308_00020 [Pyrinomonadaceae bacterium]|nr:hypothetical protein [Pyrinomonadaceae bacterium]